MEPYYCDLCGKATPGYLAGPKHSKMEVNGKTIAIVCADCQALDRPNDIRFYAGFQKAKDPNADSSGISPESLLTAFNMLVWNVGIFVVAGRQTYAKWDLSGYGENHVMMFIFALVAAYAIFGLIPLIFYGLIVKRVVALEVCWIPLGLYFLYGAITESH